MNINKLRHQVTIEKNAGTTNDGAGNKLPVWEPVATVWANIRQLRADEITKAEQTGQELTHMVEIRHRADIVKDKHRINFNGRIFKIESIVNVNELNIELNIKCREG